MGYDVAVKRAQPDPVRPLSAHVRQRLTTLACLRDQAHELRRQLEPVERARDALLVELWDCPEHVPRRAIQIASGHGWAWAKRLAARARANVGDGRDHPT
jgi:hypothetical protein